MDAIDTVNFKVRQHDLPGLGAAGRLGPYPVVVRTAREILGGGFGDQDKHPNTWTVYFLVDADWALVESARGLRREWASLDRVERWLRSFGFRYFWVRNDLDQPEPEADGPLGGPSLK